MKIKLLFAPASVAILLTGCATYDRPVAAVHRDSFTQLQESEKLLLPDDLLLLTLEKAQQIALKNNPNFKSMQFVINSARARYYQSYSAYAPTLNAGMSVGQRFGRQFSGRGVDQYTRQEENYTPALYGQILIFDGLSREMNVLATKQNLMSSESIKDNAQRLLIRAVAYAYNDILLSAAQIRIAQADLDYSKLLCKDAQNKFEAGAAPQTDVLNFQVNVKRAERTLRNVKYNFEANKYILAGYLGLTSGTLPEDLKFQEIKMPDSKILMSPELYLDNALANRPDLKSFRMLFQQSKYEYWGTLGRFLPTITGNYSVRMNANRTIYGGSSSGSERSTRGELGYGVEASWNLFNGGADYFAAKSAFEKMAEMDYQLAEAWINVITEVRTAYENYKTCAEQTGLSKAIYDLSMETRNKVEVEYKTGMTDVTRMNLAQRDLVNSENELALAIINLDNAKAQLDAAIAQNFTKEDIITKEEKK